MNIRIELPKAADLDTSIRAVRSMFDKVENIYYPKKDVKRKGIGEFMFLDPIKKWDFISKWCEVLEGDGDEPMCELSASPITAKQFNAFVKLIPQILECDHAFSFSQTFRHAEVQDCSIQFYLQRDYYGQKKAELSIEERLPRKKTELTKIEGAMRDLWEPVCKLLCDSADVTITPAMSGTKIRAAKSSAKFSSGKAALVLPTPEVASAFMSRWARLRSKLPKNVMAANASFFGNIDESETMALLLKLRRQVDPYASIHFYGKYRDGFRIESIMGTYPVEGYWRLPLFRATAGKVGSYFDADLVLTPNGNFVEYPINETGTQLEKLKSHKKLKGRFTVAPDAYGYIAPVTK